MSLYRIRKSISSIDRAELLDSTIISERHKYVSMTIHSGRCRYMKGDSMDDYVHQSFALYKDSPFLVELAVHVRRPGRRPSFEA